jgi:hypothetical protein
VAVPTWPRQQRLQHSHHWRTHTLNISAELSKGSDSCFQLYWNLAWILGSARKGARCCSPQRPCWARAVLTGSCWSGSWPRTCTRASQRQAPCRGWRPCWYSTWLTLGAIPQGGSTAALSAARATTYERGDAAVLVGSLASSCAKAATALLITAPLQNMMQSAVAACCCAVPGTNDAATSCMDSWCRAPSTPASGLIYSLQCLPQIIDRQHIY